MNTAATFHRCNSLPVQITPDVAATVMGLTVCGSVSRLHGGSVSTKFVIPGEMANVDFVKKGTQTCAGKDTKVSVSSNTHSAMKCVKGNNGWEPECARFKSNDICTCASGQSPTIGFHLASYADCETLRPKPSI